VFAGSVQIAELNREDPSDPLIKLEIYPRPDGQPWSVDLEAFMHAIIDAKARLNGR